MNSDKYALSSIVLVESIRKKSPELSCDYVCFYHNISQEAVAHLLGHFDAVFETEPISYPVNKNIWPRFRASYDWLDMCFTKFYVFLLTQYKKALFLDSDMLCLASISNIFRLKTPAGCLVGKNKAGFQSGY